MKNDQDDMMINSEPCGGEMPLPRSVDGSPSAGLPGPAAWETSFTVKLAVAFFVLMVLTSCFLGMYGAVAARQKYFDPSLPPDRWIALSPSWIWVYLLYYPFCFIPLASRKVRADMRCFLKVAAGFLVQFGAALPIFYFFPTRIIHPDFAGGGFSASALRGLYSLDGGYCVFPSLHVANTFYVSLIAAHLFPKKASALLFLVFALIAASTLLVKQHFILDIPGGLLLGYFAYWVFIKI